MDGVSSYATMIWYVVHQESPSPSVLQDSYAVFPTTLENSRRPGRGSHQGGEKPQSGLLQEMSDTMIRMLSEARSDESQDS